MADWEPLRTAEDLRAEIQRSEAPRFRSPDDEAYLDLLRSHLRATERAEALEVALRRYGVHERVFPPGAPIEGFLCGAQLSLKQKDCNCGLEAALRGDAPTPRRRGKHRG